MIRKNAAIATFVIYGQRKGEDRFPITVEIGTPYQFGPNEWVCPASLHPLSKPVDPHGNDAFQSLCLAIKAVHLWLGAFLEDGGQLTYESGERFVLDPYKI